MRNVVSRMKGGNVALVAGLMIGVATTAALLLGLMPRTHEAAYALFFYPVVACVVLFIFLSCICTYVTGESPRELSFKNSPIREALERGADTPLKKRLTKLYWPLNSMLMLLVGFLGLSPLFGFLLI